MGSHAPCYSEVGQFNEQPLARRRVKEHESQMVVFEAVLRR